MTRAEGGLGNGFMPSGGDLIDLGTSNTGFRQRSNGPTNIEESKHSPEVVQDQQKSQLTQLVCLDCDYSENRGKKISHDQQRYINSIINPLMVNCKICGQ